MENRWQWIIGLCPLVQAILQQYELEPSGIHGVVHWARVLENALRLAEVTGANLQVASLFAVLHDSCRLNDHYDPEHGPRGAELAAQLRGSLFEVTDHEFHLLQKACAGHTTERTHPDITIQTCWDSDRLDLGRVGVAPEPSLLCTDAARQGEILRWADGRASFHVVPDFVSDHWNIDL